MILLQLRTPKALINDISIKKTQKRAGQFFFFFKNGVHSSAATTTLGNPSRKHQDWFDENHKKIKSLLEEKFHLHKAHQDDNSSISKKAAYSSICKTVQNRLRDMQDSWLSKKAEEIQSFADRKAQMQFLPRAIKPVDCQWQKN